MVGTSSQGSSDLESGLLLTSVNATVQATAAANPNNQQETERVTNFVQSTLGSVFQLVAKIPKPLQIGGMAVLWAAPYIIEGVTSGGGAGAIITNIFTKGNISELFTGITSGIGFLALFKGAKLYQQADDAKNNKCGSQLLIKSDNSVAHTVANSQDLNLQTQVRLLTIERDRALADARRQRGFVDELLDRLIKDHNCQHGDRTLALKSLGIDTIKMTIAPGVKNPLLHSPKLQLAAGPAGQSSSRLAIVEQDSDTKSEQACRSLG